MATSRAVDRGRRGWGPTGVRVAGVLPGSIVPGSFVRQRKSQGLCGDRRAKPHAPGPPTVGGPGGTWNRLRRPRVKPPCVLLCHEAQHGHVQPTGPARRRRPMNAVRLLPLVVFAFVLACGPASGTSPRLDPSPAVSPAGGPPRVTGTISAGPVCPVEQDPPDPDAHRGRSRAQSSSRRTRSGQEVGRTTSAADGSYELVVSETGTVLITALPVAGLAQPPEPVSVTFAVPGEVDHIDLVYDTGIR